MADEVSYCGPCLREETEVTAVVHCLECCERLCENCIKFHNRMKSLSSHKLFNIGDEETGTDKLDFLNSLTKCTDHETEDVRYMCKDHNQLCCNKCAIVKHRKCEHMVCLGDEITARGTTYQETNNRLEKIQQGAEKLIRYEKEHESSVQASVDNVEEKLVKTKNLIDVTFLKLRQAITCEAAEKSRNIIKQSKVEIEEIETLKSEVDRSRRNLDFVCENGENVHLFLVERKMEMELRRHEEMLQELRRGSSVRNINMVEGITNQDLAKTIASCFHIEENATQSREPTYAAKNTELKNLEPVLEYEEKIWLSKCNACSCIWIDTYLVVVLHEIKQIQLFLVEDEAIRHKTTRKTSSQPWAVAEIDNLRFAVCFPNAKTIEIMKVIEGSIMTLDMLNTDKDIWDIAFDKSRSEMISLSRSGQIDIYKLDGTKSRSLSLPTGMSAALKNAYSICFDSERDVLYISSHALHKLLAIRLSGSIVFEYSSPKVRYSWHPDLDRDGNIYLPFHSLDGGMGAVHQIDSSGQLIREIKLPGHGLCVCFDRTKTKFLVSCSTKELLVIRSARGGNNQLTRNWDIHQGIKLDNIRTLPEAISTVISTDRPKHKKKKQQRSA
ncbi:uncharacterized protein LOC123556743 [Mercenaria mercenaria]|uniref:uncharacterized protein LOC123556743 n=1 Tax=Mercenaria mercenaria TaxID=6596 RepID=UPI00234EA466|nr:uncharacterized protein LOC123556743 [Mercenaria mercenaria]